MTIKNYRIYENGSLIASPAGLSYPRTGLSPSTQYQYQVSAVDLAGNESGKSPIVNGTTLPVSGITFVPNAGFTATPVGGTWTDKSPFVVTSSGSIFGAHGNFNKGGGSPYSWFGLQFLCFLAKEFEDTAIGTNIIGAALTNGIERSQENGVDNPQWVVTANAPVGRTRSARRSNISVRTDPLELTVSASNPATVYQNFLMIPSVGASSGKFSRIFGDTGDTWLATGGGDFFMRGSDDANYTAFGGYSGNIQCSTSTFNQHEQSFYQTAGKISVELNGKHQWGQPGGPFNTDNGHNNNTDPWTDGNIGIEGHTINLCDERDNPGDYIDFASWYVNFILSRFVIGDSSSYTSCTRHQYQIPLVGNGGWTSAQAALGANLGELQTFPNRTLYFLNASESLTTIGHWIST